MRCVIPLHEYTRRILGAILGQNNTDPTQGALDGKNLVRSRRPDSDVESERHIHDHYLLRRWQLRYVLRFSYDIEAAGV